MSVVSGHLLPGFLFFLYQILAMLLPGYVLLRLLRIPAENTLEAAVWGYGAGYILNIIEYLLLGFSHCLFLLPILQLLLAIVAVFILWHTAHKRKNALPLPAISDWLIPAGVFAVVFALRFFTYYGRNLLPLSTQPVTFPNQDILYYIGNTISAMKGFPLQELRYAGETFYYHYFGSLQLAAVSLSTGIDALTLEICFTWIQPVLLLVFSSWCLLKKMYRRNHLALAGLVMLFFTTGRELIVYVASQHILYVSPFGWDIGLSFAILTLTFIYLQFTHEKFQIGLLIMTLLSFFACEGSKAPVSVVILLVLGCICGIWLFKKKSGRIKSFAYGIPLVLVFVTVFFTFVSNGMSTVTTNSSGLHFSLTGHLYECELGKIYFNLVAQGFPQAACKILIIFLFVYGCNMLVFYLFTLSSWKLIRQKANGLFSFQGCLLIGVCAGLLMTLVTKQSGNSQMYFAMTAIPLAILTAPIILQKRHPLVMSGVVILFALSLTSFLQILAPSLREGTAKLQGNSDFSAESNSLTASELEGYQWVRDHTEKDAVCLTNLVLEDAQYQSFIVGVCTERQMYLEGWRYVVGVMDEELVFQRREAIRNFFAGNQNSLEQIMADGVDYVIITSRYQHPENWSEHSMNEPLFDNGSVSVYSLH